MARVPVSTLKTKFESGDRPTQQDFIDLIDTLVQQSTDLGTTGNNEHTVTGIESATVVDSFSASEWRMVKYLVSISDQTGSSFSVTELTILNDGTNVSVSEYGTIDNNGEVGTVEIERNGTDIQLIAVPAAGLINPVTVRFGRMGLKI
jgi:hypothetical protein